MFSHYRMCSLTSYKQESKATAEKETDPAKQAESMFAAFDADNSGFLSLDELSQV